MDLSTFELGKVAFWARRTKYRKSECTFYHYLCKFCAHIYPITARFENAMLYGIPGFSLNLIDMLRCIFFPLITDATEASFKNNV